MNEFISILVNPKALLRSELRLGLLFSETEMWAEVLFEERLDEGVYPDSSVFRIGVVMHLTRYIKQSSLR